MILPFHDGLIETSKGDAEMAILFDGHYSRRKIGSAQFMPPGETMVLRNAEGTVLFGWLKNTIARMDGELGVNCTVFRNTSRRRSSDIILEAEEMARTRWGNVRFFTYVHPGKIRSSNPGCCFKKAGWNFVRKSASGLHLLEKCNAPNIGLVTPEEFKEYMNLINTVAPKDVGHAPA